MFGEHIKITIYPPSFSNIYVKNFRVKQSKNSLRIFGWPDALSKNIHFENVNIEQAKQGFIYNFVKDVHLNNVRINGELQDGIYSKEETGGLPPKQT